MNVTVCYPHPLDDRATFRPFAERWVETYRKFPAGHEHRIAVIWMNGRPTHDDALLFHDLPCIFLNYEGGGIDIGCVQWAAQFIESDFLTGMTSRTYFHRPNWLKRMMEARENFGRGLYGASATFERCPVDQERFPNLHMRTVFYGMDTKDFRRYPHKVVSRETAHWFEAGKWNFAQWFLDRGLPVKMVTFFKTADVAHCRGLDLPNIFRRGDQSDLLVHDKHSDIFANADPREKTRLAIAAGDKTVRAI